MQQAIGGCKRGNEVGDSGEGAGRRRCNRGAASGSAKRTSGDNKDDCVGRRGAGTKGPAVAALTVAAGQLKTAAIVRREG